MAEPTEGSNPSRYFGNRLKLWKQDYRGSERLYVKAPLQARTALKGMPGALWDGRVGAYHLPFSPAVLGPVLEEFKGYEIEWTQDVVDLEQRVVAYKEAINAKSATDLAKLPSKTEAWLHQKRAFYFAKDLGAAGLFVEMGGGKTMVTVALLDEWDCQLVLIQCPKSVMGVWAKELSKHSLRDWNVWAANISGTANAKAQNLAGWMTTRDPRQRPRAVVVNYDTAWRVMMGTLLTQQMWDCEVLDESHKIKAPGGKASNFCKVMRKHTKRVLLLTGTPEPHGPEDLYGQYRAADPGIFGTSYSRFKKTYFDLKPIREHVDKIVGFRSEEAQAEFIKKMGMIGIVIPRADMVGNDASDGGFDPSKVWSLPPVERQAILDPKTFRVYSDLKRDLVAEIDAGIITADNALTKLLRLRQITSGHVKTEDGVVATIGTEKRSALVDVLDDIPSNEPVVVYGVFHHDLDAIGYAANEVGRNYLELSGRRRDGLNDDSTLAGHGGEVVGVQLQSGGVGVDFTRSCYGIDYSLDYNLGNILQSRSRLDRPGQTRMVTWVQIVAVTPMGGPTVDGLTMVALAERKQLNDVVLDALRKREV